MFVMPEIIDDKSEHCVPFIVETIKAHRAAYAGGDAPPFFLGLNGVQGAGKTTLVSTLCSTLTSPPYSLSTVVLSIDDLYLPHTEQSALANKHPQNPLVQHRGQPSTHDIELGTSLFDALRNRRSNIGIPSYDKSAFDGQGDRTDPETWEVVNITDKKIEVVVFEGWCVGFRPLSQDDLRMKWRQAKDRAQSGEYDGQLGKLNFDDVELVNDCLRQYDALTDQLNAFVHIDAENPQYVYEWRAQQESALRKLRGRGMTDEQVVNFVNGYYPAYELYTDVLRRGIFPDEPGKQMRLVVDKSRKVTKVERI